MRYIMYAQGTMSQDGRMRALYWCKSGRPKWLYGADADKFDENEANKISNFRGEYKWVKYPVRDSAIKDIKPSGYEAFVQEGKLTEYSRNFRSRMNKEPKKKAQILLEAKASYDNVVSDTCNEDKDTIKQHAKKHWDDLQKFADTIEDSMPSLKDKLIQSSSKEALSKNIATEIKAGKDPKQAAAIAYSIQKENDSSMKDGLNVIVKLNGKTYKGAFNGISGADKRFGDVYIPELVSLHSGDKGVFNPDEGNYVSDGKFYFKMENLKKWNPFLNDYIKDSAIKDADMFNITFERNGVYQSNLVKASSEEEAKQKFMSYAKKHNLSEAKIISVGLNKEGYKPGKPVIDNNIKDFNPRILAVLENVGKKGDAWWNKWQKILDMTKGWNSYDWVQLAKRDPKKHDMLLKNRELATKEAKSIDVEWNRAIDALSRESGKYGTDFSGYKNPVWTSNAPMASSMRVERIKDIIAEKQAFHLERAKSRRDSMPVKVIAKKAMETRDGCSRHYLEVEDCEGKRFYMVTDEYDGCSKQFSGGGSVIQDKATLSKKYKDDLASGLTSVGRSAISGAKEVKSKIKQASYDDAVDLEMYKKPLDNLVQGGQVKDGVSASKVDAMLGINDIDTTKQLLKDAGINYSPVTSKVSEYKIVEGKCVKSDK